MPDLRTLTDGIALGESPRWHDDRLWFADWGALEIIAVSLDGNREVMAQVPSMPICFDWLPDKRMLIVSGREGKLLHRDADGSLATHADLAAMSSHPWNDIAVDRRGHTYVNSIGFDFPGGEFAPGIVALVDASGSVEQVADGLAFPNGMVVTPDDETLIVAESYAARLTAFDIGPDGMLSNRRVWAELGDAAPDGICIDADNAVWYADVPHRRCARVAEGGSVLQTIDLDRGGFACALGGRDGMTLFIVAAQWPSPTGADGQPVRTGKLLATIVEVPSTAARS
ncbi:MAG: SMP-30/gluconolactonase/LRE family protein [Chloroflexi bacterium]|nr:MAG: SMP-30/gluconolactonase/LRE family protein [Chloroflexota bacterium]